MSATNRQILLNAHPVGFPVETDLKVVDTPVPEPGGGEILVRTIYLSLDPYMRGRMNPGPSYAKGVDLGEVMGAQTVGQVVTSRIQPASDGSCDLIIEPKKREPGKRQPQVLQVTFDKIPWQVQCRSVHGIQPWLGGAAQAPFPVE